MNSTVKVQSIRSQLREWRGGLAFSTCQNAGYRATTHLLNHPLFIKSRHIACYMAVHNELETNQLIQKIWQTGKCCYLPALDTIRKGYMNFHLYKKGDPLIRNAYAIPEPRTLTQQIMPWALDLVILPLVAFDRQGNRIGTGCGYYDRTFAGFNNWSQHPVLCGFAYQKQEIKKIPARTWDVPIHYIVTDKQVIHAESHRLR